MFVSLENRAASPLTIICIFSTRCKSLRRELRCPSSGRGAGGVVTLWLAVDCADCTAAEPRGGGDMTVGLRDDEEKPLTFSLICRLIRNVSAMELKCTVAIVTAAIM